MLKIISTEFIHRLCSGTSPLRTTQQQPQLGCACTTWTSATPTSASSGMFTFFSVAFVFQTLSACSSFDVCISVIWKVLMSFLFLLRLEFEDVEMGGPEMGACQNDTMMVRKCEGNICNIDNNGYTKWRKYLQPNDEIKGPLQNSSIPDQRNGRGLYESGARHSLWNPHRPTQWATSCTTS